MKKIEVYDKARNFKSDQVIVLPVISHTFYFFFCRQGLGKYNQGRTEIVEAVVLPPGIN